MSVVQETIEWIRRHKITVGLAMLSSPSAIVGPLSDMFLSKNKKKTPPTPPQPPTPPSPDLKKDDEHSLEKMSSM